MFNPFRKKELTEPDKPRPSVQFQKDAAIMAGMRSVINAKKKADPLIGAKLGAKEVNNRLINGLKTEKGVHIESFLTVLGALAGFSCQMCARAELNRGPVTKEGCWAVATGADGITYFFGDAINRPLAESQYSVWSLTAGAAQQLGAQLPDLTEIFAHVSMTVGTDAFGKPRIPEHHTPGDLPLNYLRVIWPSIFPLTLGFCDEPADLPALFGTAIQYALQMAKDVIDPGLAATIVMECAIPMSKVNLPEFYEYAGPSGWRFTLTAPQNSASA